MKSHWDFQAMLLWSLGMGLSHNVSELVDAGLSIGGGLGAGRALSGLPKMTLTKRILTIEEQMAKRIASQRTLLNNPAYRSGAVSDKIIVQIAQNQLRKSEVKFNFTGSAAKQLSRNERAIPMHIIQDIIENPIAITKDPQRALSGSRMYYSRVYRNGKLYNVEVLYDKNRNQISHFLYDKKAIGPLEKIQK